MTRIFAKALNTAPSLRAVPKGSNEPLQLDGLPGVKILQLPGSKSTMGGTLSNHKNKESPFTKLPALSVALMSTVICAEARPTSDVSKRKV
jgi:hypothetical protein